MTNAAAEKIYCALDTTDVDHAVSLALALKGTIGGIKLGLEFFCAAGPDGFRQVAKTGMPLFLDLKFHDIPNTVAGAIRSVAPLAPRILTIHTQGGPAMMQAAAESAAREADRYGVERPWVCGVTILTSLDDSDLDAIGVSDPVSAQVGRLAGLAQKNGLDGMVCSPKEISLARAATSPDFKLIVPGIRPSGSAVGDQKRVMTPYDAVTAGANVLVIGRPITGADDPVAAAKKIVESLSI